MLHTAPYEKRSLRVEPEWIDYNGHMNMAYYTVLFDLCIDEGMGAYSIARYLNKHIEDHPAFGRSQMWYKSYVTVILNNPAVYGFFQPRKRIGGKSVPDGDPIEAYFQNS